MITDRWRITG